MSELQDLINGLSQEFDEFNLQRHEVGEKKYGPFKFLSADVFDEIKEELSDLANYARYQYIKLSLLQMSLANDERLDGHTVTIGVQSFKGTTNG